MKIKAKELIKRFGTIEGMDYEMGKQCAKIAIGYYTQILEAQNKKASDEYCSIDEMKAKPVNYATKDGVIL
jgi:hypothetical protein